MKNIKKLAAIILAPLTSLALALPASADVIGDPFESLSSTDSWVFWLSIGIAAIALAVLVYLVLKARRNR